MLIAVEAWQVATLSFYYEENSPNHIYEINAR